jgi:hypothetical protein
MLSTPILYTSTDQWSSFRPSSAQLFWVNYRIKLASHKYKIKYTTKKKINANKVKAITDNKDTGHLVTRFSNVPTSPGAELSAAPSVYFLIHS